MHPIMGSMCGLLLQIKICRRGMGYIAEAVRVYEKYLAETVVRRHRRMEAEESNELLLRIGDCLCMLAGYLCTTSTHLTFAHKLDAEQSALYAALSDSLFPT